MTTREIRERLRRRAKRAGLAPSAELLAKFEIYYRLLALWNERINLTGLDLRDPTPEALDRLLVEPLIAAKHVPPGAQRMIDIGSGGGSPAIPFALAVPGMRVLMVESKTRKSVFLREAARALEMPGAEVATSRFESLLAQPNLHEAHDVLTIRAVRVETKVLMSLQTFVRPGGMLFLFRSTSGDVPETLAPPLRWRATYPLLENLRSRLVVLEKRT